jgi:hypothetical protein
MQTNNTKYTDSEPLPDIFNFGNEINNVVSMIYANAKFYRTAFISNIEITFPLGNNYVLGAIWGSPDIYLPVGTFNSLKAITEITFPNANQAQINYAGKYFHEVRIKFKLVKNNISDNYQNNRKLQCFLADTTGTPYDNALIGYTQPATGFETELEITGDILHNVGDSVNLKFNIVQDNLFSDQSATTMIIYGIVWNISSLKIEI